MMTRKLPILILLSALFLFIGEQGVSRWVRLSRKAHRIERENRLLAQKNGEMIQEIQRLKDPATLERLIRAELGFARPDEHLYEFSEP